jgi:hypothetical protein
MADVTLHDVAALFPGPSAAAPTDVGERSTAFQPVEGGTEHRSGEALLVTAYAGLWLLLMVWLVVQWTKQTALARRVGELEEAVARVGSAGGDGAKPKVSG